MASFFLSPRFLKRLISAMVLGPLALVMMVAYRVTFFIAVIPAFLLAVYEWAGFVRAVSRSQRIRTALIGLIYVPMCFYAFTLLRFDPTGQGWFTVLMLLLAVWASDTGGYVFGKAYGGPKWVPSISPNKTWAGLLGAMILPGLMAPSWMIWYDPVLYDAEVPFMIAWTIGLYFLGGCVLGFVCQMGDLFISVFKRRAGLKDTGTLIPGHGGILDRIDALMMAALFGYVVLKLFWKINS